MRFSLQAARAGVPARNRPGRRLRWLNLRLRGWSPAARRVRSPWRCTAWAQPLPAPSPVPTITSASGQAERRRGSLRRATTAACSCCRSTARRKPPTAASVSDAGGAEQPAAIVVWLVTYSTTPLCVIRCRCGRSTTQPTARLCRCGRLAHASSIASIADDSTPLSPSAFTTSASLLQTASCRKKRAMKPSTKLLPLRWSRPPCKGSMSRYLPMARRAAANRGRCRATVATQAWSLGRPSTSAKRLSR